MTTWLTVAAFARLRRYTKRRARQQLVAWERKGGTSPRVQRVAKGRGPRSLCVCAEDVAALYAVDVADVHQLAA